MRRVPVLVAMTLAFAPVLLAKDPPSYDQGVLLAMESTSCGYAENGSKTVAGELLGTDAQKKKTQELLCQEYTLQGDRIVYRIRPKDDKHPVLLPLGEKVQFRIRKDKMYVRDVESDQKEQEYVVVSMKLRTDSKVASDIR
jgi:hypothetical protein